jgi:hypothetical protein
MPLLTAGLKVRALPLELRELLGVVGGMPIEAIEVDGFDGLCLVHTSHAEPFIRPCGNGTFCWNFDRVVICDANERVFVSHLDKGGLGSKVPSEFERLAAAPYRVFIVRELSHRV